MASTDADDQILDRARAVIANVMRISIDKVQRETVLVRQLGADSMDFIDIMFGLETAFGVEFCEEGMFAKLEELFGEDVLSERGLLTELGGRVVQKRRPELDPELISPGLTVQKLNECFTTETWVRGVREILDARPSSCSSCGSARLAPLRISRLSCEDCGTEIACPTQADLLEQWSREFQASTGSREP